MANTSTEDLPSKDFSKPFIRTMENDLKSLKANPSLKSAVPAPKLFDDILKKTPASVVLQQQNNQALNKIQIKQDDKYQNVKEKENFIQLEAEKEMEKIKKKDEEFKKEREKAEKDRINKEQERLAQLEAEKELEKIRKKDEETRKEREKVEQAMKEKEEIEQAKKEKEKAEIDRINKEKERLIQIKREKELEKKRKKDEEIRIERERIAQIEREKAEQIRKKNEEIEKAKKVEIDRINKEKERIAQIEREKETEIKRKRDEELRKKREKAEQVRKEKEMIEQAKKEEAMKIKKKLSEEIKQEMEEEIKKEKEKAEQVKIEMELEIKKEIETAEAIKRERESAMKKRVAKVIKEEMDAEIEKEKEKAEEVKKEVEIKIKEDLEEEIKKEKELEEEIKEEMAIGMRKEIAEQIKKDKEDNKNLDSQIKKESVPIAPVKTKDSLDLLKTGSFLQAVKLAAVPENLPINQAPAANNQGLNKMQINGENKNPEQILLEEELEIIKKKDEDIQKERKIAEQLKREKERLEKIIEEKEGAEKKRVQIEKEKFVQDEARKVAQIRKETTNGMQAATEDKNVFAFKNAWKDSPLNSEFFADAPSTAPAAASVQAPVSFAAQGLSKKESEFPDFKPAEPGLEKSVNPPVGFSPKKKLSSFFGVPPTEPKLEPLQGQKKTAKKQYSELSNEYEHLSPEMRLAQQGFSSISSDLEEGARRDAELMDQNLALKKKVAASSNIPAAVAPPFFNQSKQSKKMQVPAEGVFNGESLKREPSAPIFKTILKILAAVLLAGGIIYGIYYFVFKGVSSNNIAPVVSVQPVLTGIKNFEVAVDFDFGAMPVIKEYVKNNPANTGNVSQVIIKDNIERKELKVSDFGKTLGVIMPTKFLNNLTGDYSLLVFNYPKDNYLRMGMVLKVKDANAAVALAKEWEPSMFVGTSSFLFDAMGFYDNSKSFGSSNYKSASIKYLSLGKNNLALNYTVNKNKNLFIFATSQEDIYYLINEVEK